MAAKAKASFLGVFHTTGFLWLVASVEVLFGCDVEVMGRNNVTRIKSRLARRCLKTSKL